MRMIALLLLAGIVSASAEPEASTESDVSGGFTIVQPLEFRCLHINFEGGSSVSVCRDGTVTVSGVDPDEGAQKFWDAVQKHILRTQQCQ